MRGASNNPQLVIFNNTAALQKLKLFNGSPNAIGSINAGTKYTWDVSAIAFAMLYTGSIQVKPIKSSLPFVTLNFVFTAGSGVAGVVAALNALNVGSFYSEVVGGTSLIRTSNDQFIFGDLFILDSAQWIFNGFIQVNNVLIGVNNITIMGEDFTTSNFLSSNTGPAVPPPTLFTFANNISYPLTILKDGDAMRIQISTVPAIVATYISVLKQNGIVIASGTVTTSSVININFTYLLNATYELDMTVN